MRRAITRLVLAALAAALAMSASTPAASAGTYVVRNCTADPPHWRTTLFRRWPGPGDSDMRVDFRCSREGRSDKSLTGVLVGNRLRKGLVPAGDYAYAKLQAPPGLEFVRVNGTAEVHRRDCRYAMDFYARNPSRPEVRYAVRKTVSANHRCPRRYRRQKTAEAAKAFDKAIPGATNVVARVRCMGGKVRRKFVVKPPAAGTVREREPCSGRTLNVYRLLRVEATLVDNAKPALAVVQNTPFTRGAWTNSDQTITYVANDLQGAGVQDVLPVVGSSRLGGARRPCDPGRGFQVCPNGSGTLGIDVRRVAEGEQNLVVQGLDAAGNPGASAAVRVRIERTAPQRVSLALAGGDAWRSTNSFNAAWVNGPEPNAAPIDAVHYSICPPGKTTGCVYGTRNGSTASPLPSSWISQLNGLTVPRPGEWDLRMYRRDAAGNAESDNASEPIKLRFDPDPPQAAFQPPSASDPTRIVVAASDQVSGLASGQIEISRAGTNIWQALPTQLTPSGLTTRIDDARLPAGTYVLRASARDRANNLRMTDRRADGQPMVLRLPLRVESALTAGFERKKTVTKKGRRGGKKRRVRPRVTVLAPTARAPLGRGVQVVGRLTNRSGTGIPGAQLQVYSRTDTTPEQLASVVRTDGDGNYSYPLAASSSRVLRVAYAGTTLFLPSQSEVTLRVPAASTIRANRRRLLNGQAVTFNGRLRGLPVPAGGKLVEIQVKLCAVHRGTECLRYEWQTFRTTRSGVDGSWRARYPFRRTCGVVRYRFRARVPREAAYPFERGITRTVGVRVRGKPC